MAKLFGIKSCDSCRAALQWLRARDIDATFHDFRADGHDAAMLKRWDKALGWEALLNKRSLTWRRVPEADRHNLNAAKAIHLMLENPTLIKRPILEHEATVHAGFSPDAYEALFPR
ncbi:MAG: arsenate reductase [Woeseia sp.]